MSIDEEAILSDFTRFYLLVLLYEEPIHGYGLRLKFKKRLGKNVSYSLIYPYLSKLEKKDYLRIEMANVGQKEKKLYHLTSKGKNFAEKMFHRFSRLIDVAIEPNIQICAGCGVKLYQNAYQEIIKEEKLFFCCKHCSAAYKKDESH